MKTLRTAVVGLGRIGWQFHVPQIARHEGFELAAVVDPVEERLAEALSTYGVKGYGDYDEMLAAERLDLVVIASPTLFHADQAIAAFARGCNVFCDKPMAPTLAEADRMIAAMHEHRRKLMIYQPYRASAETAALQAILAQDLIGPVFMIKYARSNYDRRNDWQAFRRYGGGMLNNYGAHHIDLLLHLSGSRAARVTCMLRTIASLGDAEDVVKALIETESGMILDLDIITVSAHPMPPWQVLGQRGSIVLDLKQRTWQVRYYRKEDVSEGTVHEELIAPGRRYGNVETIPWQEAAYPISDAQAVDFYEQCYAYYALDQAPYVPIHETREVMRVLDMCRRDAGV